jgi:hypothetical protein
MKKAVFTLLMLLLVSTAYAADAKFEMTGTYWAEGKYWFNYNAGPRTDAEGDKYNDHSFGFYEQDITLFPKITVNDTTSLNFMVEITDTYWGAQDADSDELVTQSDPWFITMTTSRSSAPTSPTSSATSSPWMWASWKAPSWGTTFGDDSQPQWRVKLVGQTSYGILGAILEKNKDWGAFSKKDDYNDNFEGEDRDSYGLFGVTRSALST